MIYVDRAAVPEPKALRAVRERELPALKAQADERHASKHRAPRRKMRGGWQKAKPALRRLFQGKCAYCESTLSDAAADSVDHFRPKQDAAGLDAAKVDPDHYWWLAYDWENLYLSCRVCNSHKRNLFPVLGKRARSESRGEALRREKRLLLDPCVDDPEESLRFDSLGAASGLSERGDVTIKVCGLNRPALRKARRAVFADARRHVATLRPIEESGMGLRAQGKAFDRLRSMCASESPHAAVVRQLVRDAELAELILGSQSWAQASSTRPSAAVTRTKRGSKRSTKKRATRKSPATRKKRSAKKAPTKQQRRKRASIRRKAALLEAVWIDRIEIKNFKSLEHCELEFAEPTDDGQPWLMLIGENGVGKSSILQAIALATCAPQTRGKWAKPAHEYVNRQSRDPAGFIKVQFSHGDAVELHFERGDEAFTQKGRRPSALQCVGYGSTRLPSSHGVQSSQSKARVHVDNLFNPFVPLSDASRWLANTRRVNPTDFSLLSEGIAQLLGLHESSRISRRSGKIFAHFARDMAPIDDLSDGYRSVVGLATDLMRRLSDSGASMKNAVGTVLLDELEGHLHPTWKMRIVGKLRELFPAIRFVVTTHDPLCLRGLRDGEIHKLARDPKTHTPVLERIDLRPGLRADEILTGRWFDLASTLDEDTTEMLDDYQDLLRARAKPTDRRRLRLESQIRQRLGSFVDTREDRIARELVAQFADDRPLTASEKKQLKSQMKAALETKL